MVISRLFILLFSLAISAGVKVDPNQLDFKIETNQTEHLVKDVLQTQILQESLVQANHVLQEQFQTEVSLNFSENLPKNCQRAHAGFHAKPSKEVILRGNVARLLEIATLQVGCCKDISIVMLRKLDLYHRNWNTGYYCWVHQQLTILDHYSTHSSIYIYIYMKL